MMIKNVVILTLSSKFGGYCVAAYDASENQIIRLVKDNTLTNGIPKWCIRDIDLLDIVSIKVIGPCPKEHQTENVKIDLDYGFKKTGKSVDIKMIYDRIHKNAGVFGSTYYKLDGVSSLEHSLEIIKFENMCIYQNQDGKTKADFSYNSKLCIGYSVTDTRYYGKNKRIPSGYSIVSLPATDDFTKQYGYFKYISAVYPS